MNKGGYVYILTNRRDGTIYVGVTNDIERRLSEHRLRQVPNFTKRYNLDKLVYLEVFEEIEEAIAREKQLKSWRRPWKVALIEKDNPAWIDLSVAWDGGEVEVSSRDAESSSA